MPTYMYGSIAGLLGIGVGLAIAFSGKGSLSLIESCRRWESVTAGVNVQGALQRIMECSAEGNYKVEKSTRFQVGPVVTHHHKQCVEAIRFKLGSS